MSCPGTGPLKLFGYSFLGTIGAMKKFEEYLYTRSHLFVCLMLISSVVFQRILTKLGMGDLLRSKLEKHVNYKTFSFPCSHLPPLILVLVYLLFLKYSDDKSQLT